MESKTLDKSNNVNDIIGELSIALTKSSFKADRALTVLKDLREPD